MSAIPTPPDPQLWCAACATWGQHTSRTCPTIHHAESVDGKARIVLESQIAKLSTRLGDATERAVKAEAEVTRLNTACSREFQSVEELDLEAQQLRRDLGAATERAKKAEALSKQRLEQIESNYQWAKALREASQDRARRYVAGSRIPPRRLREGAAGGGGGD